MMRAIAFLLILVSAACADWNGQPDLLIESINPQIAFVDLDVPAATHVQVIGDVWHFGQFSMVWCGGAVLSGVGDPTSIITGEVAPVLWNDKRYAAIARVEKLERQIAALTALVKQLAALALPAPPPAAIDAYIDAAMEDAE